MSKPHIQICMGSSCFSRGNRKNLEQIERYLATHRLEGSIELAGSLCAGRCADGPNLSIDGTLHTGVDPETVIDLLEGHFAPLRNFD